MTLQYTVVPLSNFLSSGTDAMDILIPAFNEFRCEKEIDLEYFLKKKAIMREEVGVSSTYLFIDRKILSEGKVRIIGFVSLAATSLSIRNLSQKQRRRILGSSVENRDALDSCPAFLIGQLGRNDRYDSKDLAGKILLYESVNIFKAVQRRVAITDILTLECYPYMYNKFYRKYGFSKFPFSSNKESNELLTLCQRVSKVAFDE